MVDFSTCPFGRVISASKQTPAGHIRWFNANLVTRSMEKVWFGDIDILEDKDALVAYAEKLGQPVYVLREMDARFNMHVDLTRAVAMASHVNKSFWYKDPYLRVKYDERGSVIPD